MRDEIAIVLSIAIVALCAFGIYSRAFRDNWLQLAGMSVCVLGALMIFWHAWTTERTASRVVILLLGVVLYGGGTAWKVWLHERRPNDVPPPPDTLPMEHWPHVAGGKGES